MNIIKKFLNNNILFKYMNKDTTNNHKKIIVFDLDETIGHFTQLGIFYDIINNFYKEYDNYKFIQYIKKPTFDELMNIYPEFLRPNMIQILQYIKKEKDKNKIDNVMIYTNNQGHNTWANMIVKYLNKQINEHLIKNIIRAFKIGNTKIEPNRTSHMKTYNDFLRCTKLPKNTKICFIDDVEHKGMIHDNVYYINILPYEHKLPVYELLDRYTRFLATKYIIPRKKNEALYYTHFKNFKDEFIKYTIQFFQKYKYKIDTDNMKKIELNNIISVRLLQMIKDFIND